MRVRYLPRAFADLEAIHSYIGIRNPEAALRTIKAIRNSIVILSAFPEMGQASDDLGVRILHSSSHVYKIYHRVAGNEIQILHIRHAARKPPAAGEL